jgi:hypothetical protein
MFLLKEKPVKFSTYIQAVPACSHDLDPPTKYAIAKAIRQPAANGDCM